MSTMQECKDFGNEFLDPLIEWVANTIKPDEVYSEDQLINWAHGMDVSVVATEKDLEAWALDNGFVKDTE